MAALLEILGVTCNLSMAYHLQTDSQTKWLNQDVKQYLQGYINYQQNNWHKWLDMAEFVYNNQEHSMTAPFSSIIVIDPGSEIQILQGG